MNYQVAADRSGNFTFIDTAGRRTTESYASRDRRTGGGKERPASLESGEDCKPWIAAHLAELDTGKDGNVSKSEMLAEAAKTFAGYDRNRDGRLAADEYNGRSTSRSAMGGFVKEHFAEFDIDRDQIISRAEVDRFALRMFARADHDGNNLVTQNEANTRGSGGGKKGKTRPR